MNSSRQAYPTPEKRVKGLNFDLGESIALLRESVRQFAQIQSISIGGIVGESHIRSLFVPYRHISLHQHRAGSNAPHRQHVC